MNKLLDWQPIETAPNDGSWILLCGGKTTEDFYMEDKPPPDQYRPVVAKWDDAAWVICYWDGSWRDGYDNPTHWMPITEKPE